ncbi:MAG: TetR/AcrR family transcriptional regulator [Planctomycetes bacterium]|nr:TetR/AcrR family transcriptional regulator [Planctomycetota bacterium]
MGAGNLRDAILDAVGRVVARNGLSNTTIDAIAAETGISKGGVLYYFANKKELLFGMVDRYSESFFERREKILAELPDGPTKLLKATVRLMIEDLDKTSDDIPNMAGVLDDAELRQRVGVFKQRIFEETSALLPHPEKAALVLYTIDGIWMGMSFQPTVISAAVRSAVVAELMAFVEQLDAEQRKPA